MEKVLRAKLIEKEFTQSEQLIHLFAGGSYQHGARLEGKNDLDICGVYVQRPESHIGIDPAADEHFIPMKIEKKRKNVASDVDIALYSLKKWAFLAAKGNPTVLSYLFVPAVIDGVWPQIIVNYRSLFLASSCSEAFLGFAHGQLCRLEGITGPGKHGQRPELEALHGYDTKAAMHMIRMMLEGLELLRTGKMTFPNPRVDLLMDLRLGKYSLSQVKKMYFDYEAEVKAAALVSPLPAKVDRLAISSLIATAIQTHWANSQI
jgi:predicted nucleotidyltransferase